MTVTQQKQGAKRPPRATQSGEMHVSDSLTKILRERFHFLREISRRNS